MEIEKLKKELEQLKKTQSEEVAKPIKRGRGRPKKH